MNPKPALNVKRETRNDKRMYFRWALVQGIRPALTACRKPAGSALPVQAADPETATCYQAGRQAAADKPGYSFHKNGLHKMRR